MPRLTRTSPPDRRDANGNSFEPDSEKIVCTEPPLLYPRAVQDRMM